jgi:phosphatidate cytidylyltransferase
VNVLSNPRLLGLIGGVLLLLGIAEVMIRILRRRPESSIDTAILETFRLRVRGWEILFSVLAAAFLLGPTVTIILFFLISFWALREFITLTPTRPGDHRTLFWVFFLFPPLHYFFIWLEWYGTFFILIPVYAFLFVPASIALTGDYKRFLERTAKIQAGLLICVYCLSCAPALLTLKLPPLSENTPNTAGKLTLLFFFLLIVQLSDALQYAWSQIPSRHVIAPTIHPSKTWEGLLGGTASAALVGAALWWATPFSGSDWWMSAVMSAVIAVTGFAGSLTMSAIKRDRGVKDFGTLVEGHGGLLDRIDSICFAAPIFFHCTRWWLVINGYMLPLG